MKKTILVIALSLMACTMLKAQDPNKPALKKDSVKAYKPNPNRVYYLAVTDQQLGLLVQSSQAGILPLLKTTKTPMDQLDQIQTGFNALLNQIMRQYRQQYVADSLKATGQPVKKPQK